MLFLIPFEASILFENIFTRIDAEKSQYAIISWNLQVCNLEEVFLKVASQEEEMIE